MLHATVVFPLRRRRARDEEPLVGTVRVHEHQVRANAPGGLGDAAQRCLVDDELGREHRRLRPPAPTRLCLAGDQLLFVLAEGREEAQERDAELRLDVLRRLERAIHLLSAPAERHTKEEARQ